MMPLQREPCQRTSNMDSMVGYDSNQRSNVTTLSAKNKELEQRLNQLEIVLKENTMTQDIQEQIKETTEGQEQLRRFKEKTQELLEQDRSLTLEQYNHKFEALKTPNEV